MRSALWLVAALALSSLLAQTTTGSRVRQAEERDKLPHCTPDAVRDATYEEARMQAGLLGMKGPGVELTMDDSPRSRPTDADRYFYIVHDVDLQANVNELWAVGAEAIAINDQRVVSRTAIRCTGPTILVNGVRLSPPYIIRAIGPADEMAAGLGIPGGFLDSMLPLVSNGGTVTIAKRKALDVPAYTGRQTYHYARPVP